MSSDGFEFDISKNQTVNKFGRATNVDSGITTDVWDGANATLDQDIWIAPTQARKHAIVSSDGADTSGGAGAKTIQVYGLKTWNSVETSEVITMAGVTPVNTIYSYVIIHRMKVLTKGASGPNVGIIKATAASDNTITAQINSGEGQTQMSIYGIGSTTRAWICQYYASVLKGVSSPQALITLKVNPEPQTELLGFVTKHSNNVSTAGTTYMVHKFNPYQRIDGPAIIKIQANGTADNLDISAGFDLILKPK